MTPSRWAGGVADSGTLRAISVIDAGKTAVIDLYQLSLQGIGSNLPQLSPDARIHVPQAGPSVMFFGAVKRQLTIELLPGETLDKALAYAGGTEPGAETQHISLLRESGQGQQLSSISIEQLASMAPVDGDRLLIPFRQTLTDGRSSVQILGAVVNSGYQPWHEGMTMDDAFRLAGGLIPGADTSQAVVQRLRSTPVRVDLGNGISALSFRDLRPVHADSDLLEANDILTVPLAPELGHQLGTVSVQGQVLKPGTFPLSPGMSAGDVLLLAGGVLADAETRTADIARITVGAGGGRTLTLVPLDLHALLTGDHGPKLQNLDTIIIRARFDERIHVRVSGQVANSGTFIVPQGTTLRQVIAISGGLTSQAFPEGMRLNRPTEAGIVQEQIKDMMIREQVAVTVDQQQISSLIDPVYKAELGQTILNEQNEIVLLAHAQATGRMAGINLVGILKSEAPRTSSSRTTIRSRYRRDPGTIRVLGEVIVPGSLSAP